MIQKRPCRMEAEGWVLKTNDFDLTGGLKKRSNLGGGSGGAGKNGARVTYELMLITNEYTECGERIRGGRRMESGRATLAC
jgi:hypothetical protein